jgi:hypothetical protein
VEIGLIGRGEVEKSGQTGEVRRERNGGKGESITEQQQATPVVGSPWLGAEEATGCLCYAWPEQWPPLSLDDEKRVPVEVWVSWLRRRGPSTGSGSHLSPRRRGRPLTLTSTASQNPLPLCHVPQHLVRLHLPLAPAVVAPQIRLPPVVAAWAFLRHLRRQPLPPIRHARHEKEDEADAVVAARVCDWGI